MKKFLSLLMVVLVFARFVYCEDNIEEFKQTLKEELYGIWHVYDAIDIPEIDSKGNIRYLPSLTVNEKTLNNYPLLFKFNSDSSATCIVIDMNENTLEKIPALWGIKYKDTRSTVPGIDEMTLTIKTADVDIIFTAKISDICSEWLRNKEITLHDNIQFITIPSDFAVDYVIFRFTRISENELNKIIDKIER